MTTPTELLTVQQAAEQTGLSEHTLRYFERVGLLLPVDRAVIEKKIDTYQEKNQCSSDDSVPAES
jgi:hypothetical protein